MTTNTVNRQQLNEEMRKLLKQLSSPNELTDNSNLVYNKLMNTSYIVSACHTPTSMSFVSHISQISPMSQHMTSKLETTHSDDLPVSSALSFLSSTLYSSSKTFNEEQNLLKKPGTLKQKYNKIYESSLNLVRSVSI